MSAPNTCQSAFVISSAFTTLASVNLNALVKFYSDFLTTSPHISTSTYAEFQLPGLRLAIFSPAAGNASEFAATGSGAMSLCLEVNDLEAAIARLRSIGHASLGTVIQASHGREIYAYDPDGNRLILHQSRVSR
ncbi:VOC family protein [cf. Phormidesmis sp. LEGE 11477]|nr:VOC family protein [cf. Phormidesmis sp. LEGE 11477]